MRLSPSPPGWYAASCPRLLHQTRRTGGGSPSWLKVGQSKCCPWSIPANARRYGVRRTTGGVGLGLMTDVTTGTQRQLKLVRRLRGHAGSTGGLAWAVVDCPDRFGDLARARL